MQEKILNFQATHLSHCDKHGVHKNWSYVKSENRIRCIKCSYLRVKKSKNKNIIMVRLGEARRKSKKRKFKYELNKEFILDLLEKQSYQCALTGQKFKSDLSDFSIDRINSNIGYEKSNVHLVLQEINVSKWDLSLDDYISLCKKVVNFKN